MSSQILIKATEIEFKNGSGTTGTQSINNDGNIAVSRVVKCTQGITSASLVVAGGSYSATTDFDDVALTEMQLNDDQGTPAKITVQAPATVSSAYTVTMPAAQGANGETLSNNGSGALSWTALSDGQKDYARMRQSSARGTVNYNTCRPFTFDTQDHASNITCNTSTGLFTVSRDGIYIVEMSFSGDDASSSSNKAGYVAVNGTPSLSNIILNYDADSGTDNFLNLYGTCVLSLSANDTVGVWTGGVSNTTAISDNIVFQANAYYVNIYRI